MGVNCFTKSTAGILVTHFNHKEQEQHICCSLLFSSLLQEEPTKLVGILFVKSIFSTRSAHSGKITAKVRIFKNNQWMQNKSSFIYVRK